MTSLRIGDADRQKAIDRLAEEYAVGRLTRDEFDERSDAVWSARTEGDLAPVFADLPATPAPRERARRRPHSHVRPLLVPLVVLLVVLTAITHLPLVFLGLAAFFFLGHRRRSCGG